MTKAHKTAIKRREASAPMRRLATDGLIKGRALDYGCGHGRDADTYNMARYDPHYHTDMPAGWFDTITCNYVLNVIESNEERLRVLRKIQVMLESCDSVAYITVRNDRRALNGTTKTGTWQALIVLALPVRYKCSGYVTYELRQGDALEQSSQAAYTET